MNVVRFGWDLSWEKFEMVYHVLYRTVLVFHLPVYFLLKFVLVKKGCKINDSIVQDKVRVL